MRRGLHKLRVPEDLAALIRGLHPELKSKVRVALELILAEPDRGKPLTEELAGLRSFRIGKFRLIYRLHRRHVELLAFGARERIYEETYRLIARQEKNEGVEERRARYVAMKRHTASAERRP